MEGVELMWWIWHLLYDNPLFGRRLFNWVCERRSRREFEETIYGIYGLNWIWQQRQRRYIVREGNDYKLLSPRSRV
jgi:hypothetical protein